MKSIWLFLFGAATLFAQNNYTTGQAARLAVGQETFTSGDTNSSDTILGAAAGVAYAADTLFVADDNQVFGTPENNRVLLFTNLATQLPSPTAQLNYNSKCPVCVGAATVVLGQPDMTTTAVSTNATQNNLRQPTAVASDGVHVVVADTNHNRVLIWNSIPTYNNQPADVVVGQPDFVSIGVAASPSAKTMRGPQGVWIQNGKLYVADTQDNRVLIYNKLPTSNGAAADVVLGQPDFTTVVQPTLTQQTTSAAANNMLDPVSVTSDGLHLFVADLGYSRVLIWNSIPTTNQAPADVEVGQPNFNTSVADNGYGVVPSGCDVNTTGCVEYPVLCTTTSGTDVNGNPTYPTYCNSTLSFPRFALSDGTRLYISDSGEDRILVFNQIPTQNAQAADTILGQIGGEINQASNAADSLETPGALAWDGSNLYVADIYNRRIEVFTMGANSIPYSGARNAASLMIFSVGSVTMALTASSTSSSTTAPTNPTPGDSITILIGNSTTNATSCTASTATATGTYTTNCGIAYTYQVVSGDTLSSIVTNLISLINEGCALSACTSANSSSSGDPNVFAYPDPTTTEVLLTAKAEGIDGNNVTYSGTASSNATETATASGSTLTGGGDASQLGAGTTISILGQGTLSANTISADLTQPQLPTMLGGTQVYVNGIPAPLYYVSPAQINAQIPWEVNDQTSVSIYVRSVMNDGSILVTTPIAATIVPQNPGVYTQPGYTQYPMPGVILHAFSQASGVILLDGSINAGDIATVTIQSRSYNYTIQSSDTLSTITTALMDLINQDPQVSAETYPTFANNIILKARLPGPDGDTIAFTATTTHPNGSPELDLTATNTTLCCANIANSPVTADNPAVPGETLLIYGTGLGLPVITANDQSYIVTGQQYPQDGPITVPLNFVSSLAGGKTANVLYATLVPGTVGTFAVALQLNPDMCSDPLTQLYIAQDVYISNIVTFPLIDNAPGASTCTSSAASDIRVPHKMSGPMAQPKAAVPGSR
jgi:uncharacterized protein (TIGR03437 family)